MSEHFVSIRTWKEPFTGKTLATVYVKEGAFFRSQGGMTEEWGKHWQSIDAVDIEDARRKGHEMVGAEYDGFAACYQANAERRGQYK